MRIENQPQGASVQPLVLNYGVGNTPLQAVNFTVHGVERQIHLKLEGFNPTHSMKDRTAYGLLQAMEEQDLLHPGSTVIESTSGNLGVALARLCSLKGYHFIAVIDPKTTTENIAKMRSFGAQVEQVTQADENGGYLLTRLDHLQNLLKLHPDYVWTNQYENPANPASHSLSTGPEIYVQTQGQVDVIFAPVSTGGTLAGIGRFFRQVQPKTRIIGVDAVGSVVFGTPSAPRKLTGIGSSRASTFLHSYLYDTYLLIGDEEAFAFCRALRLATHISVGGSSGATLAACARYLAQHPEQLRIICICADSGDNYNSTIFNDQWLEEQDLKLSRYHLSPVTEIRPASQA